VRTAMPVRLTPNRHKTSSKSGSRGDEAREPDRRRPTAAS
jgi:hypothetical protein